MLSVPGIVAMLGLSVPVASLFTPLCVLAAVATWFAGHPARPPPVRRPAPGGRPAPPPPPAPSGDGSGPGPTGPTRPGISTRWRPTTSSGSTATAPTGSATSRLPPRVRPRRRVPGRGGEYPGRRRSTRSSPRGTRRRRGTGEGRVRDRVPGRDRAPGGAACSRRACGSRPAAAPARLRPAAAASGQRPARPRRPARARPGAQAGAVRPDRDLHAARGPGGGFRPADQAGGQAGPGARAGHARLHRARRAVGAHAADPVRGLQRPGRVRGAQAAALRRSASRRTGGLTCWRRTSSSLACSRPRSRRCRRSPTCSPTPGSTCSATPGSASPASARGSPGGGAGSGRPWLGRPGESPAHVITLLTRPGCHLCDDARAVIASVAAELGIPWQERDITESDSDLRGLRGHDPGHPDRRRPARFLAGQRAAAAGGADRPVPVKRRQNAGQGAEAGNSRLCASVHKGVAWQLGQRAGTAARVSAASIPRSAGACPAVPRPRTATTASRRPRSTGSRSTCGPCTRWPTAASPPCRARNWPRRPG